MRIRFSPCLGLLPLTGLLCVASPIGAATLQSNVSYGATGAVMNLYVPDKVDQSPGIVVALHYCGGSATNAASFLTPTLAEQYGFIVIAPGLPSGDADGCWDVGSAQTLTHDGGSHSKAIVQMVKYAITKYNADPKRVFVAGASSGAMMTNVLLGAYPDVFAAGSALAGVPFGCWTAADGWTSACANGTTTKTAQQWGDQVRNAYPGYTGTRPRVQLFHGTADTTLNYKNLAEEVKQWTNVLGLSDTPSSTEQNTPKSGWTRTNYKSSAGATALQVSIGSNVGHDLTGQGLWNDVIKFFGLDQDMPVTPGTGGAGGGGAAGIGGQGYGGVPKGGTSNGGASTGGSTGVGGGITTNRGGASSGGSATGGLMAGGAVNSGGTPVSSGSTSTSTGTGGAGTTSTSSGGATTSVSGGTANDGNGGTTVTGLGGGVGIGGGSTTTTGGEQPPPDDGGCSIRVQSRQSRGQGWLPLLTMIYGLGALVRRRRRRES